jgi:competence protein ComGF
MSVNEVIIVYSMLRKTRNRERGVERILLLSFYINNWNQQLCFTFFLE